ncbi:MAG: hypothetical protein CL920_23020 [Deltaproteobacteria bacterium]|nr:hypothetical protein [Deltaproteobacteria bacterium]
MAPFTQNLKNWTLEKRNKRTIRVYPQNFDRKQKTFIFQAQRASPKAKAAVPSQKNVAICEEMVHKYTRNRKNRWSKIQKNEEFIMNKKELIAAVAETTGLTQKQVGVITNAIFAELTQQLSQRERMLIRGFGTFDVADRAPRTIVHPGDGKKMNLPARTVPVFRPSSELKELVAAKKKKKKKKKKK